MAFPLSVSRLLRCFSRAAIALVSCSALIPSLSPAAEIQQFYIREYRVEGSKRLKNLEVEEAVYPYMGPGRTPQDVENARLALEKTYHDKGYQTVSIAIPEQDPRRGIIRFQVKEGKVGRLRVNGAKWFLPSRIKHEVPSVAEGSVPNLNRVGEEMVAVNRINDRRITPELRPGIEPGSVDIDLNVEDKFPMHGSLELNNRYSADTTPLRLNGALSYGNLFQLGHTIGGNFQVAPENTEDALVYSAYYMARVSDRMSLMLTGTKQDSDISTLGGAAVAGKGEIIGLRAMFDLPAGGKFFQSFNLGMDYKNFTEDIVIGKDTIASPIEYYPISANYAASWIAEKNFTEFNTSLNFHLRGMGSDTAEYAEKRFDASGNFIFLRGDIAHTRDLAKGAQLFAKVQGQIAGEPLINSEQISGGGLGTVRGYLEATALGDNGIFGSFEFRSPTYLGRGDKSGSPADEWRFYSFADAGLVGIYEPLASQKKRTGLASIGLGSRIRMREHYHGSVDVAVPLIEQTNAEDGDVRITFRGWADF